MEYKGLAAVPHSQVQPLNPVLTPNLSLTYTLILSFLRCIGVVRGAFPSRCPSNDLTHFICPLACYMHRPSLQRYNYRNNVSWRVQIMKLLIISCNFSISCYIIQMSHLLTSNLKCNIDLPLSCFCSYSAPFYVIVNRIFFFAITNCHLG